MSSSQDATIDQLLSSDDEFFDVGDEEWYRQYHTDEEEDDEVQSPGTDMTANPPRNVEPPANVMPEPNTPTPSAAAKGKGKAVNPNYSPDWSEWESSSQGTAAPRADVGNGDTDNEDDTVRNLAYQFEQMKTGSRTNTHTSRSASQPTASSSHTQRDEPRTPVARSQSQSDPTGENLTPQKRAFRNMLTQTILSGSSPSQSPSPSPSRSTHTPPRATASNLSRSATMPTVAPERMATPPLPRSRSMGDPEPAPPRSASTFGEGGYVIIAHDQTAQGHLDALNTPWGVQYEIARGVNAGLWAWDDVTRANISSIYNRRWSPRSVQRISTVLNRARGLGTQNLEIWAELDREQKAIIENVTRGLGLLGSWEGENNWYGGRVQQIARLVQVGGQYTLQLSAMQKVGRSHRLGRYLGSRRVLQVKLPPEARFDPNIMSKLKTFLSQKFVLCGRVFEAFSVKDEKVYLVETDENYERNARDSEGDQYRCSLKALVDWYNPLRLNSSQSLSKYAARADLAMSTSVPVLEFRPENIFKIDDLYAPHSGRGKVPTEKIYTDGCGFMNGAALMKIGKWMGFGTPPTAVQGRILGSKGVWMLHPHDRDPEAEPKIWIRSSQMKINLVDPASFGPASLSRLHRAHLIFDLVMPSRSTVPARLSRLTIVNLQHNGVPTQIMVDLMKEGLTKEVEALTQWRGASAMPLLWHAVNKASAVSFQRLRRSAAGIQRALGLTRRRNEDVSDDEDDLDGAPGAADVDADGEDEERAPKDNVDAPPASIAEGILERIQAGFTPLQDFYLYDDLKTLLKQVMKSYIKEYHIIVPESAEAFIVPDPFGILEENEIHFKSSQDLKDGCLHLNPKSVTGDVLIYRNPARVPSDVQKVKAVCKPELADYIDVIVLPTKGPRSLASLLAGGDVDGDVAVCIFNQDIVQTFRPPRITLEPRNFLDTYFEPLDQVATVASVMEELKAQTPEADLKLREHLLIGLSESKVGKYSMYHENAIYKNGYDDPETLRLAYMFTTVLDSRKTGLIVKADWLKTDENRFGRVTKPVCLGGPENAANPLQRSRKLETFVLDVLLNAGKHIQDGLLHKYEQQDNRPGPGGTDPDILRPWREIEERRRQKNLSDALELELQTLKNHVGNVRRQWGPLWASTPRGNNRSAAQVKEQKKDAQRRKNELAALYAQTPEGCSTLALLGHVDELKASYLYSLNPKIALSFAHQALCKIKASSASPVTFTREFADAMSIPNAEARVRSQFNAVENLD